MSTRSTGRNRRSGHHSVWPATIAAHARLTGTHLRDAWARFLGRFPWEWFVTLTFDPKRIFPVSRTRVEREAIWWGQSVAKACRSPVGWICAPERGRGGLWHGHVLMLEESKDWSPESTLSMWRERNGRIDAQRVTDQAGITLYTTKQAAAAGTIMLSDTLTRYQSRAGSKVVVPLCPAEEAEGVSR